MVHVHPRCKLEREARQAFSRLWTQMHLGQAMTAVLIGELCRDHGDAEPPAIA